MRIEQAIYCLKAQIPGEDECCLGCEFYGKACQRKEALKIAVAEMEKSIPKAPRMGSTFMDVQYYCPTCNNWFTFSDDRCGSCGQLIDWNTEDDRDD